MKCSRQFALTWFVVVANGLLLSTTAKAIEFRHLWTHDAGGPGRAEIVAYDEAARQLLVVNGAERCVMQLDVKSGREVDRWDQSELGDPTSVAAHGGFVAVAVVAPTKTDRGYVVVTDTSAAEKRSRYQFHVGAQPDMITFTSDGQYVLAANEGEPNDDMTVDPVGSISVLKLSAPLDNSWRIAGFESFNSQRDQLVRAGVRITAPSKSASDGWATVAQDLEPEYIAVSPDSKTAWVTLQENNALAVVDIPAARVTRILPLGLKDHSRPGAGLDASADDGINIQPRPVAGMYQPDGIAAYDVEGQTYLVTVNEGDSRPYREFCDEALVKDLKLDPALGVDEALRQLKVSRIEGDTDGDGDVDCLLSFGARSIAIWDTDGKLLYDSGDALERFIGEKLPERFNMDSDGLGKMDDRSDDKGPEPEGLVLGRVNGSTLAFVGLERTSAVAVFDVTRPHDAKLLDILPLPLEKGDAGGPCIAPEGLCFVPADRNPFNAPLLAVACEVTGTTILFEIDSVSAE